MSTLPTLIISTISVFLTLFFYWRRVREDYISPIIFSSGFLMIGFLIAFSFLSYRFLIPVLSESSIFHKEGIWFWAGIIGLLIGFIISVIRFHLRFFETFEAIAVGPLLWFGFLLISTFLATKGTGELILGSASVLLFFFFFLLDRHYKKFNWYKSGKVGFSGLTVLALFFVIRAVLALVFPTMISLTGKVDAVLSALVAFLLFFSVYNLSELE